MRLFRTALAAACLVSVVALSPDVRANDLAAEAELQFEIGADLYGKGDFRGALEHWLASNRLAPNKNVVFNIARAYEQLKRYPEAFLNYDAALAGETDGAARKRIEEAIQRISPNVAVLLVESDPPGATVYVDRKDLGARGATPRRLGLAPGKYKVLVELPGHEGTQSAEIEVKAGEQRPVKLSLEAIVGTVTIEGGGAAGGATVKVEGEDKTCTAPCALKVVPGRQILKITKDGYEPLDVPVNVVARGNVSVAPALVVRRGAVVVQTDVRDAAIEVDGKTLGFSPAVLQLPVGKRIVRVKLPGYRTVERVVEVKPGEEQRLTLRLLAAEEISAVSRTAESVEDAPASLSIVTGQELRSMRYSTVAEALRGVRGAYVTDDRTYTFVGFRGVSRTQDYGNKVPILQDGLLMNDNLLVQSFAGHEGRTDLDDVERIEVVRGPGSVLYGTNAFLGVINLVTRRRDLPTFVEGNVTTSDYGFTRMRATGNVRLAEDASFWVSVAGGRATGRDFYFKEYAGDAEGGNARSLDGFDVGTVQGRFSYKTFTMQGFVSSRNKLAPSGEYETTFGDKLNFHDTHGRLEARFEPQLTKEIQSLSRAYLSTYDYTANQPYAEADGGVAHERYRGRWYGIEQRFLVSPVSAVRVTAGGEYQKHYTATMDGADSTGPYLSASQPYDIIAGYGLVDITPSKQFKVSAGARVDKFSTFGTAVNPRGAIIYHPYDGGTLKVMGGKAFRAPSFYERLYVGPTQVASPDLKPENIVSGEVEYSHRFGETVTGTGSVYYNHITGLVVPRGAGTTDDPLSLTNSNVPVNTLGAEAEVRRDFRDGWMLSAWYAYQHTAYDNAAANGLRHVPNSPAHLASLKASFPLIGRTLTGMTRITVEDYRWDRYDTEGDPPQGHGRPGAIWDLVFSGEAEGYKVSYALGFYNLGDYRYSYPISGEFRMRTMIQPGRTTLASLTFRL